MALYLGNSDKLRVKLDDGVVYSINIFSPLPTVENVILSSSDDCLLQDFNGLYLAPKEVD